MVRFYVLKINLFTTNGTEIYGLTSTFYFIWLYHVSLAMYYLSAWRHLFPSLGNWARKSTSTSAVVQMGNFKFPVGTRLLLLLLKSIYSTPFVRVKNLLGGADNTFST